MPDVPLVSICIPTYNAEAYLEACLNSAITQTYNNIEILIVDDGSTDRTSFIVKQYQQLHPQIRLIQNASNRGMVNNWNDCVKNAAGQWIKFLFQDDLLEPECVEEMLLQCQRENVRLGLCSRTFLLEPGILQRLKQDFTSGAIKKAEDVLGSSSFVSPERLAMAVRQHLIHNFIGEPTCYFFHKSLYLEAGPFNPDLSQVVDYEFFVRLGMVNGFAFVAKPLAHFRVHQLSQSSLNKQQHVAEAGELILLQHQFLHHPNFATLRAKVGLDLLETNLKHIYYSTCKHRGKRNVNEGLRSLRTAYPIIGDLHYTFFKYVIYRHRMKNWYRQLEQEKALSNA